MTRRVMCLCEEGIYPLYAASCILKMGGYFGLVCSALLCSVSGMMEKLGIYDGMSGRRGFLQICQ